LWFLSDGCLVSVVFRIRRLLSLWLYVTSFELDSGSLAWSLILGGLLDWLRVIQAKDLPNFWY
jgi:hypothetical protein